jgi:class 3 adenylate cyclase
MFTDIVGSTRLAETLGDDAWERLLAPARRVAPRV